MIKYILTTALLMVATASFGQSRTIQETQFANSPQQWDNQLITLQNVEVTFEVVPPQSLSHPCKVPKPFELLNLNLKGAKADFNPCFIISHQMKVSNAQKVGGQKGRFDITLKGTLMNGYVISILTPSGE